MRHVIFALFLLSMTAFGAANVPVYMEQGGAKQVIGSGGEVQFESGSTLDIQAGTTFTQSGTTSVAAKVEYISGSELQLDSGSTLDIQAGTTIGNTDYASDSEVLFHRVARCSYDVAVDGGTSDTEYELDCDLPANAVIEKAFYQVVTAFTGDSSVAMSCESAADLKASGDVTGLGDSSLNAGIPVGTAAYMISTGSDGCTASVTIGDEGADGLTAGKLVLWVEYVIGE